MESLSDILARTAIDSHHPSYVTDLKTMSAWERQGILIKMYGMSNTSFPTVLTREPLDGKHNNL